MPKMGSERLPIHLAQRLILTIQRESVGLRVFLCSCLVDICQTPGPNAFFPQATRTGRTKGPAFSLQGGFKKG